jgi:hypothetical protein
MKKIALVLTATSALVACNTEEEKKSGDTIRIAAMYSDTGSEATTVTALQYAATQINEAGFIDKDIEIIPSLFTSETDRKAKAQEMVDDFGAVGLVSEFSSTALQILQITQSSPYDSIVSCSGSSTNPKINNPETPDAADGTIGADRNDTLYRTIANDLQQARLVWGLIENKEKLALFTVDDAYGKAFLSELTSYAAADSVDFAHQQEVPVGGAASLYTEAAQTALSGNRDGSVSTVVVIGFTGEAGQILKSLVEANPPFAGEIILSDGAVDPATFVSQTGALATWLGVPGNSVRATVPDNASGANSASFESALQAATSMGAHDSMLASHVDCLFSMSMALAAGSADGLSGAAAIKAGMLKQKDSALAGAADIVTITPTSLADVAAAVEAGKSLRLDGASGVVTYDDDGDRAVQLFSVMVPQGTGPFDWAVSQTWDAVNNECISGC